MVGAQARASSSSLGQNAVRAFSSSISQFFHGIHVFQCPDVVGVVAKLSECIASRGGNINSVDVFVPENKKTFYYRSCDFVTSATVGSLLNKSGLISCDLRLVPWCF